MAVIMLRLQGTYYIDTVFVHGDVWVHCTGNKHGSFTMLDPVPGETKVTCTCKTDVLKTACPELWADACAAEGTKPDEAMPGEGSWRS